MGRPTRSRCRGRPTPPRWCSRRPKALPPPSFTGSSTAGCRLRRARRRVLAGVRRKRQGRHHRPRPDAAPRRAVTAQRRQQGRPAGPPSDGAAGGRCTGGPLCMGQPAYHALTYGWLVSGLARAVTGIGMRELIRIEIARPLNTDGLHLGRPPADAPTQVAQILAPQSTLRIRSSTSSRPKYAALWFSGGFGSMYFPGSEIRCPGRYSVPRQRNPFRQRGDHGPGSGEDVRRDRQRRPHRRNPVPVGGAGARADRQAQPASGPQHLRAAARSISVITRCRSPACCPASATPGWADRSAGPIPAAGMSIGFVHNRLLTPMLLDQAAFVGLHALIRRDAAQARKRGYGRCPRSGRRTTCPGPSRASQRRSVTYWRC